MPGFALSGRAAAPVEDVWKLLFDPTRFPEWWYGFETVDAEESDGSDTRRYAYVHRDHPGVPIPQVVRGDRGRGRVTVSCQVSDVDVTWQLAADDRGTRIEVRVELAAAEAHREPALRTMMTRSLASLAAVAAAEAPAAPP
ncbi:MAG TPA: SRPBCC family protein [Actinomycetospora sp.]|nr:SRPBCC family protein [Actinomycetospora sp.]